MGSRSQSAPALAPRPPPRVAKPDRQPPALRPALTPRRAPSRRPEAPAPQAEPAVLLVGAGASMEAALTAALARHGVFVETASADAVVDAVVAAAPDLILLVGDAARDCGSQVLAELAASPLSSVVPAAILDDNTALDARLRAFRHGASAIIPNSASADAIADQVARLAREIPERDGGSLGDLGESTLEDLVFALGKELRSGVLSVRGEQEPEEKAVRLVLGEGRPLTEAIDEFVTRLRGHIVLAEPLKYEFDERAGGTVQLLGADADAPAARKDVSGLRILLADDDAARADAVAQQLRSRDATVVVTDLDPSAMRFERLRQVDPTVLLIGEQQLQGAGYELIRRMRQDTRLRWASLLVVRWGEVWGESADVPAVDRLLGTLNDLDESERSVRERADTRKPFDTRLETMGPTRMLRALTAASHPVRLTVFNPRVQVILEISNELVVSASAHLLGVDLEQLEGPAALAAFLVLGSGRAHVEAVAQTSAANIMATIDVALNMADAEPPPIPPSLPSPASDSTRPPFPGTPALRAPPALPVAPNAAVQPAPAFAKPAASVASEAAPTPAIEAPTATLENVAERPGASALRHARRWLDERTRPGATPARLLGWLAPLALLQLVVMLAILTATLRTPGRTTAPAKSAAPPLAASPAARSAAGPTRTSPPSGATPPPSAPAVASGSSGNPRAGAASLPVIRHARAPSCKDLLAKEPPRHDGLPGAAYRAIQEARRELVRGDVDASQRAYCRAAAFDRQSVTAAVELTRVLLLRRDGHAAAEWTRRAGKRGADNATVQDLLGDAFALTGDFDKARSAWLRAHGDAPGDSRAEATLADRSLAIARGALRANAYARGERYFRRATVLAPESVSSALGLAHALLLVNVPADAVAWARYAIAIAPRNAGAQVTLGDALHREGRDNDAKSAWKKALELQPANLSARARLKRRASR